MLLKDAGHNMTQLLCLTNALFGQTQLPDSSGDSALAERFHTFFTTKLTDLHRTIESNTE